MLWPSSTAFHFIFVCSAVSLEWDNPTAAGKFSEEKGVLMYSPDFIEGDIRNDNPGDKPRNVLVDPDLRWPGGVVYYSVDKAFNLNERAILDDVFALFLNETCITFVERTTQRDYVSIQKTGTGCNSYIGKIGGAQVLSLDSACLGCHTLGCAVPGTPIHEFMHALGFVHEHSRPDRDKYININWGNIYRGMKKNFAVYKPSEIQLVCNYDYASVMHYGAYAFAADPSVPTMIAPKGVTIGKTDGLSSTDTAEINQVYCQNGTAY